MNTDKIYAESIAKEYAPKNTSKVMALRKLDRKAKLPAEIFAYTFGIISSLIFGVGMCLGMQVIGPQTCIGCPHAKTCQSRNCGCSCSTEKNDK